MPTSNTCLGTLKGFGDQPSKAPVEALGQRIAALDETLPNAADRTLLPSGRALLRALLVRAQSGNAPGQGPENTRRPRKDAKVAQEAQRHTHQLPLLHKLAIVSLNAHMLLVPLREGQQEVNQIAHVMQDTLARVHSEKEVMRMYYAQT